MAKSKAVAWYNQRKGAAIIAVMALVAAYFMGSRSIDTGSLQEYFLTFVLIIAAVNRAIKAIRG